MSFYCYQEELLHKELDKKINDIRTQAVPVSFIEGSIGHLREQYKNKFDQLDRKKQYLRDIMPFLKSS